MKKGKLIYLFKTAFFCFIILSVFSCNTDDNVDPDTNGSEALTFPEVIATGSDFESFSEEREESTVGELTTSSEDVESEDGTISRFVCNTRTISLKDGKGEFSLFNTNADVIFPGNLLQGKTLSEATPSPIVVKRAGGTISIDVNNGNATSFFEVDEVKKSTIQDAINNIIAGSGEGAPANFQLDIKQVESEQHLAVELGISVETFNANVSSNLSFSLDKQYNRTLVKLNQSMYTMSFDLPTSIDQIFHESVTPEDLSVFIQPDNPAAFISSVTFGRIFYMLIETTSSRAEMDASLQTGFASIGTEVDASLNINAFQSLKDLKVKVIAYGGDASGSLELAGESNIELIAKRLANSTDIRFALPLSYVVRSLKRPDQIVGTNLATEFDVKECELVGQLPKVAYRGLVDIFGTDDKIGAAFNLKGSIIVVYNQAGNKYAVYDVSIGTVLDIFDHNDPNGPLGVSQLSEVGAGLKLLEVEDGESKIILFDGTGLNMQKYFVDMVNFDLNTSPVGNYKEDIEQVSDFFSTNLINNSATFAFPGDGIAAAVGLPPSFSAINNNADRNSSLLFSASGFEFMQFLYSSTANIKNQAKLDNSALDAEKGPLFDKVGAAAIVKFGNTTQQILFINEEGTQMMYLDNIHTSDDSIIITESNFSGEYSGVRVLQ